MLNVAKLGKGRQQLPAFDADAVWWHTEQLSKAGSRESAPSFLGPRWSSVYGISRKHLRSLLTTRNCDLGFYNLAQRIKKETC